MNKVPLTIYVIGVVIVLAIVICIAWFIGGSAHAWKVSHFAAAFLLGMLAMYIAMHVYKHKENRPSHHSKLATDRAVVQR